MNTNKQFRIKVLYHIRVDSLEQEVNRTMSDLESEGHTIIDFQIMGDNISYTAIIKYV